jgi:protein-S-isoprenylcysteine O-methyltransferase Ste14
MVTGVYMPIENSDDTFDENQSLNSKKVPLTLILMIWVIGFPIAILVIQWLQSSVGWTRPSFTTGGLILIAVSIVIFVLFAYLGILPIRKQQDKRPGGFLSSFIILLYIEMYGFPLTTFFFIWLIGDVPGFIQGYHFFGKFGAYLGEIFILVGGVLILAGWHAVYYGSSDTFITTGLYKYVRHPQYLGILLATFGLLLHWITIILMIMFPILIYLYYRLAKIEDAYLEKKFGTPFTQYKEAVPMFIPYLGRKSAAKNQ